MSATITARSRNAPNPQSVLPLPDLPVSKRATAQSGACVIQVSAFDGMHGAVLKEAVDYATRAEPDPFQGLYGLQTETGDVAVLPPPFSPYELLRLPAQNNTLEPCIEAMVTNCESFGHVLEYIGPKDQKESSAATQESTWITDLLTNPNPEETVTDLRKKKRRDFETLGYAFWEVGRDSQNDVAFLYHIPGYSMRMCVRDADPTAVQIKLKRGDAWKTFTVQKRFRRYVQIVGVKRIYFKEFGDPRVIDVHTGKVVDQAEPEDQATEIIMFSRYTTGETYGLPRWINNLPAVLGSRECELNNLQFFKDNAIPALAVLIAGGMLTRESVEKLRTAFSKRGMEALNRVLVLEAQSTTDVVGAEASVPIPRIEMKPLANERQSDSTFSEYDKSNMTKLRSSFRLPPIFLGLSEDYTYATAESSLEIAESQVFAPERADTDNVINNQILARQGIPPTFWKFRSNPAKMAGSDTIMASIKTLDQVGAMTPNMALRMTNELFGTQVPLIPDKWGDLPIAIVKMALAKGALEIPGIANMLPTTETITATGGTTKVKPTPETGGSDGASTDATDAGLPAKKVAVVARKRTRE